MSIFDAIEWGNIGQWVGATVTFFTALIALRTSNNAYKAFMLDKRPYLAFDRIEFKPFYNAKENGKNSKMKAILCMKNVGKTIAHFEVKKFDIVFKDMESKIVGEYVSQIGRIPPGLDYQFFHPLISCEYQARYEVDVNFTIVYFREETEEKYEWSKKMKYLLDGINGACEYRILEDNEKIIEPKRIFNRPRKFLGI